VDEELKEHKACKEEHERARQEPTRNARSLRSLGGA